MKIKNGDRVVGFDDEESLLNLTNGDEGTYVGRFLNDDGTSAYIIMNDDGVPMVYSFIMNENTYFKIKYELEELKKKLFREKKDYIIGEWSFDDVVEDEE